MNGREFPRRIAGGILRAGQHHIGRHIPYPIRTRLRLLLGLTPKMRPHALAERDLLDPATGSDSLPAQFDIVCFPIIAWDFRFQRPQQLMRQLARQGHRIFWIDPDSLLHGEHLEPGSPAKVTRIDEGIFRVSPGMATRLNIYQDELDPPNYEALQTSLEALERDYGIAQAVSIVQLPFWADAALALRRRGWRLVYDCMDDHEGFETNTTAMTAAEKRLARGADTIVVTSSALERKLAATGSPIVRIPNGCDVEHFRPTTEKPSPPAELEGLPHPIIGYHGAISAWFDFDLLRDAVSRHPDWSFVLVGSTFGAPPHEDLAELPNVHFLGEKAYSDLPAYVSQFDAAIIPFQKTPLIEATDPVKAYEYLAADKPVVTSDLPELRPHGALFARASSAAEFTTLLENALEEEGSAASQKRLAFARANSWESRAQNLAQSAVASFPLVSIIIVTWNNISFTKQCLHSLLDDTTWPNYEVILVDNGSTDETVPFLANLERSDSRVRLIRNEENRGFAAGNNQGLAVARGDFLVLLNNDTVLPRGWLARLIRNLESDPEIGQIGPVTNNVWNEARQDSTYADLAGLASFSETWAREHRDLRYPIDVLAMYCVAMPRRAFEKVGKLDERYGIGMFEDDDYSHRIRAAGFRVVCAEEVYVHHAGRASFRKLAEGHYQELHDENRGIYEDKWAWTWRPHQGERHKTLQWQKEIDARVADHAGEVVVFPPNIGWAIDLFQRPQQIALALGQLGYLVFFCLHEYDARREQTLRQVGPNVFLSSAPLCAFDNLRGATVFAMPYNGYEAAYFHDARLVYESIDEIEVFDGNQERMRREHTRLVDIADVVVASSDQLLAEVRKTRPNAILVPNGVDVTHFGKESIESAGELGGLARPIIGYYGALARWLDYSLIRALAQARPQWSFVLLGPDHDGSARASAIASLANVHLPGARPYQELPTYLAAFDVATIPFRVDHTTRAVSPLKLFEYLAGGCPIVTADLPECRKINQVRVATSTDDWLEQLEQALAERSDPTRRAQLRLVASEHTWESRAKRIMKEVERAQPGVATRKGGSASGTGREIDR